MQIHANYQIFELTAKNCIPANYKFGGLQMTVTIQKYKSKFIQANFKVLYTSLTNEMISFPYISDPDPNLGTASSFKKT